MSNDTSAESLGDFLREHHAEILPLWLRSLRDCAPATRLPEPDLTQYLPAVLDRVADAADRIARGDWSHPESDPTVGHAMQRLTDGFELRDIVTEFFLLRHVVLELVLLRRAPPESVREGQIACWAIDASVRESVAAYSMARQRALQALDRVSSEALASETPEQLFSRALDVVLESSPEVDSACLVLAEGDQLIHRASLGIHPESDRADVVSFGEGLLGRVATRREALATTLNEREQSKEEASLRSRGVRALYAVPLLANGGLLGVLQMGSASVKTFSRYELVLLSSLADRIGAALYQAQLRARTAQLALELRLSNEKLAEADRNKSEFLGVLSHELRNPLTPIRNSLYVLERTAPGSEQARRAQAVIQRQVDHLTRLVDDLLDVTRVSHGKIRLQVSELDLVDVVRRTLEDHRTLLEPFEVEIQLPRAPVAVSGDAARIAQILGNLLGNAAKFTPRGGKISVHLAEVDGRAVLELADTGIGIEGEILQKLFEPFTQADRTLSRTQGGLGLGLALVKSLVELHGGDVRAHSDGPGTGARFTIRLPLGSSTGRKKDLAVGPRLEEALAARDSLGEPEAVP